MALGKLHLLLLHFPIAMIVAAALADGLWLWRRGSLLSAAGYWCILLGAAAAIPTALTGSLLMDRMTLPDPALGETHEALGWAAMGLALAAAGVRLAGRNRLAGRWGWVYAVLLTGALVVVSLAGHWGGRLAFGDDYLKTY